MRELEPLKLEIETLFADNDETVQCVAEQDDVIIIATTRALYALLEQALVAELEMPRAFKASVKEDRIIVDEKQVVLSAQF